MIYRVTVKTNGIEHLLHDPRDEEIQLIDPTLSEEVGKNGTFTFGISPLHPNKDKIIPMASEIIIWKDKELICRCRMLDSESDFYNTGNATCEGELAYLLDSIQRPYEYTGSLYNFFVQLLTAHNNVVEERKRFEVGNVTIAGTEITRTNSEYSNTMAEMLSQLTGINGGYLRIRYANGKKYLDYMNDYGGINNQTIRFGENLIDLTKHVEPMELITVLIPTGATIKSDDSEKADAVVNITSVNNGKDYIHDAVAVAKYGQIWGNQKFEDVTDPEALLAKARAYLEEATNIPETIEIKAIDLSLISVEYESLNLGYWTNIISKPHGLRKQFLLSKKTTNLVDPARNSIVLGKVLKTFTGEAAKEKAQITARINAVASNTSKEINRKVENATQLITGGKGGYVVLDVNNPDTGEKMHPWRILIMDTPEKETARSVIQFNKNGFGFSTTGINGPYRNAWTIDGNLVADFITTGSMLADRIRGGMLEVGGKGIGRDGSIVVKNVADTVIGTWDKTGLHVLLGVIEGSTIRGSSFIGGAINIGEGTFAVNGNGEVVINAGEINIGNVYINPNYTWLGDYGISAQGSGLFYSRNGEVEISTSAFDGTGPAIEFKNGNTTRMRLSSGGLVCRDIYLTGDDDFWDGWSLTEEIKLLHNRVFGK